MRPNQQNNKNRQRGRNNNGGRKHVNPLSRNFESNGPDVKVRGNAAHIAEKYLQLARDAQSSGDSVMAENYLQHAEHYFRIVAAAQPQFPRTDQFGQQQAAEPEDFDDDFPPINDRFASPEPPANRFVPQQHQPDQPQYQPQQPQNYQQQQPQSYQPQQQPVESEAPERDGAEAVAEGGEAAPAQQAEGGNEPRRHRERRPRRRPRTGGEGGNGDDPSNSPQPELPAFLTAGTTTTAAE